MHTDSTGIDNIVKLLINLFPKPKQGIFFNAFLAQEEFTRLLEVERSRSDRAGVPFALLKIPLSYLPKNATDKNNFLFFLKKRFRITDSIGMIDRNHLGIVLFATDYQGALNYLQRLAQEGKFLPSAKGIEIYIYPEAQKTLNNLMVNQRKNERISIELQADIALSEQDGASPVQRVITKDISNTGVYLKTQNPIAEQKMVEIKFITPLEYFEGDKKKVIQLMAKGTVTRKENEGMAISFDQYDIVFSE